MECNYKFQFDEVQGHLRAQRRPSCERQHHLRGTGHCPVREVSTSNPHNESIKMPTSKSRGGLFFVCADLLNLMTLPERAFFFTQMYR